MGEKHLKIEDTVEMFRQVAQSMIDNTDLLTKADQVIGDGDHGIGMRRGFEQVSKDLNDKEFSTLGDLLKTIGYGLMNVTGGASGVIFGSLFIGAAKVLSGQNHLDANNLTILLQSGLESVKKRGKAQPGDKTVVDALEPAAKAAENKLSLTECITAAAEAARVGMEETKNMVANFGRAKSLGDRALGSIDPGSISIFLILNSMKKYILTSINGN